MVNRIIELFDERYSILEISKLLGIEYAYVNTVVCDYMAKELSELSGDE